MKNKTKLIKQGVIVLALMIGAISIFSFMPVAAAQVGQVVDPNNPGGGDLREVITRMLNYFLTFLGLLAVIMVIYGGVTYVTSAGNDEAVGNAKKIIMYALIGIIVIMLSFVLVNAIIGAGLDTPSQ